MSTPNRTHFIPFSHIPDTPEAPKLPPGVKLKLGPKAAKGTRRDAGAWRLSDLIPVDDQAFQQAVAVAVLTEAKAQAEAKKRLRQQAEDTARARLVAQLDQAAKKAGLAAARQWKQAIKDLEAEFERDREPGHAIRCEPQGLTVVEVTARIREGQFLLRPDPEFNCMAKGVIGRAQHFTGVHVGATHILSGHLGAVLAVQSPDQLADFTNRVFGQLADRTGRLRGFKFRIWGRRNRSIVVDPNPTDVGARLKYCLANATKEHLVAHPSQWPGVHSARLFCSGERMLGKWTDYTALAAARKRDPNIPESAFQIEYEVVHSKMPGLDHLSDEAYRALMVGWCDEAAAEAAAERKAKKRPEPGDPERLTQVSFEHIPESIDRSSAPAVHAHDPDRRKLYRQLVRDYREHLRAVRQRLTEFLQEHGLDLPGQAISPNGWRPVDPATVVPPPAILIPEPSTLAQT